MSQISRKQFRALQKQWYQRLKAEGFKDLEYAGSFTYPGQYAGKLAFTYDDDPVSWESREEYYRVAGRYLHEHKFRNEKEREIFALHVEGNDKPDILKKLRLKYPGLTYAKVRFILDTNDERMLTGPSRAAKIQTAIDERLTQRTTLINASKHDIGMLFKVEDTMRVIYKGMRVAFVQMKDNVRAVRRINKQLKVLREQLNKAKW